MDNSFSFNFFNKKNLLIFIIGLFASIQIRILGTLSISELMAVLIFPFINLKNVINTNRMGLLILFIIFWIFGVIISDYANGIELNNFFKGIGNVIFLMITIFFSYWLLKTNPKRILLFALGMGISSILQLYFFPSSVMRSLLAFGWNKKEIIEIYISYSYLPMVVFVVSYLYLKKRFILSLIILESYAIFTLFNLSRNVFLTFSISFFILLILGRIKISNKETKRINFNKYIGLYFLFIILFLYPINETYSYMAKEGTLGEKAKNKYLDQSSNEEFGILSGRIDFFEGLYGISENPIIGYGSYAKDNTNIRTRFAETFGLPLKRSYINKGLPGHSYIVGAWLFAGILSLPFWIYVIFILLKYFKKYLFEELELIAYIVISIITLFWNVFFSPFSGRLEFSMVIVTLILIMNASDNKKLVNKRIQLTNAI
jgi:hypothetical protein